MFLWAQHDLKTALLAVTGGLDPRGLSQRRSGGHWVSGDPAGIESEAGRRALSQRRAGGMISCERRAWGAATCELGNPPAGLGEPPPAADISRDRRPAVGYGGRTSGDFLATGQTNTGTKQNTFEKRKTIRGEWAPLTVRSGLLSRCTHEGGTGTRRRGCKLK